MPLQIKKHLAALRPDEIKTPNLPMAHALQEAQDLAKHCSEPEVKERLLTVGLAANFVSDLERRVELAREAQAEWNNVRDVAKSKELVAAEKEAHRLRSEVIAACRFNLKGTEDEARLSHIRAGESVDDLVQDLYDLAKMLENNLGAFERDTSFDAAAQANQARTLAEQLSSSVSQERGDSDPMKIREFRDRAFTYMDELVSEVRSAGRYAFRSSPSAQRNFASRYRRRMRGPKSARRTDVVQEEVVGDLTATA